ncbi:hypothetical protein TsFJ059_003302 [Trichoderma semiorbis]|uniref:Uncharacterized protein n=2 Tax=Trichoderma TaxID=5543 RepID=A0A9P8HIC2_9HYPO|nr:hypothetical protein TsFJ059_003302 [Trichoderma semiorbis]OPB43181.1 hypothetical protein A0O28_0088170 [Trichoderma guizhouense]
MFPTLVRRLAQSAKEPLAKQVPLTIINNPYKARKVWPPDFKGLTHQQQLRFEKKYKRRITLAHHSPRWEKGVKYAQLITIGAALVWLLFYSEFEWWGRQYKPSEELRKHYTNLFGVLDPEKRYERRKDAPEVNPSSKTPESK